MGLCRFQRENTYLPRFTAAGNFHEGLAWFQEGETYRYIDKQGTPAFPLTSEIPGNFAAGLVRIRQGGRYGYADKSGKLVLEPRFLEASQFTDGLGRVHIDRQTWGYADRTGKIVIRLKADMVGQFAEGLAPVKAGGKWGYIDKTGRMVITPQFDEALPFSGGSGGCSQGREKGLCGPDR